jgi:hypothetical protein
MVTGEFPPAIMEDSLWSTEEGAFRREKYLSERNRTMMKFGMPFPQSGDLGDFSFLPGQVIYSKGLSKKSQ